MDGTGEGEMMKCVCLCILSRRDYKHMLKAQIPKDV